MNEVADFAKPLLAFELAKLVVEGAPYDVTSLKGREEISELFSFDLICRTSVSDAPVRALIGRKAALVLSNRGGAQRRVETIIAEASDRRSEDGTAELTVRLVPEVFLLTLGRDSRVFQHMTVPQIVAKVLERSGAKTSWRLVGNYRERVYTAQYREDDWTFVARLLEEEGIYYWFDETTTLVFADESTSAPTIGGDPIVPFHLETGMMADVEHLHVLGEGCQATPTKFTVGSFNEQNPALKVSASAGTGHREMYDAPGAGPIDPAHCEQKAKVRLEGARAARHTVRGAGTVMRLIPGQAMVVAGHERLDGELFITRVEHEITQRREFTSDAAPLTYSASFAGLPKATPYRPPAKTPLAEQAGLQSGRVVGPPGEEIHTDDRGRVRMQLHWDREGGWDDQAGKWMRVAQRGVASSMLLPRIGWNALTFMEEGAPDAPVVLSRVHDADHPPTYALPANKTKTVFRTMTSPGDGSFNEVSFEDIVGGQLMFLNASKDMNYMVKDSRNDSVCHNQTRNIGGNQDWTIGNEKLIKVINNQKWTTTGNEKVKVDGARNKAVNGDETSKITGNFEVISKAKLQYNVKQKRTLEVTGAAKEECKGNIGLEAGETTMTVKADLVRNTQSQMNEEMGKHTLTIGGNKLETSGGDNVLNVNLVYVESITGNCTTTTNKRFMDSADETASWTIGGSLTGTAPYVHVEAKDLIELVVGSSTITIDKESVTISAPSYDLSSAPQLIAKSAIVKQN